MQMVGMDGMRYLGADPTQPADITERVVMLALVKRVIKELDSDA
jgi:hypothetical protein